jgi:hypothetical protein
VGVYVDDLIITGKNKKEILKFKLEMTKLFRMSDLGLLHYYLGIEVSWKSDGIALNPASYAKKILDRAGMVGCNPCKIPMEPKIKLSKDSTSPLVDATFYRSLVEGLRYLVNTRPDLAFSVGYVSKFMQEPRADHLAAVKHILRYVAVTVECGLFYPRGDGRELTLMGYSGSDVASDVDGRRSTTGIVFFLCESPVTGNQPSRDW